MAHAHPTGVEKFKEAEKSCSRFMEAAQLEAHKRVHGPRTQPRYFVRGYGPSGGRCTSSPISRLLLTRGTPCTWSLARIIKIYKRRFGMADHLPISTCLEVRSSRVDEANSGKRRDKRELGSGGLRLQLFTTRHVSLSGVVCRSKSSA